MNDQNQKCETDTYWLAIAFLVVMFYGEPDLCGALIHWLMK